MPTEITTNLEVSRQSVNIDVESIAPIRQFGADSYDVANSTITANVNVPADDDLPSRAGHGDGGEHLGLCPVRVGDRRGLRHVRDFQARLQGSGMHSEAGAGKGRDRARVGPPVPAGARGVEVQGGRHQVAAGPQVLRIHASQKLWPVTRPTSATSSRSTRRS